MQDFFYLTASTGNTNIILNVWVFCTKGKLFILMVIFVEFIIFSLCAGSHFHLYSSNSVHGSHCTYQHSLFLKGLLGSFGFFCRKIIRVYMVSVASSNGDMQQKSMHTLLVGLQEDLKQKRCQLSIMNVCQPFFIMTSCSSYCMSNLILCCTVSFLVWHNQMM